MKADGGLVEFAISDVLCDAAEDAQVAGVLPRPGPTDWSGDSSLTLAGAVGISCGTPSRRFLELVYPSPQTGSSVFLDS
jgi:hypothetical protein